MPFEFGDTLLVPFPFTSQTESKKRLAVVRDRVCAIEFGNSLMRAAKQIVVFAVAVGLCGNAMSSESHSTTLYLQRVMRGGVLIDKPRTAIALARVFVEDLYGQAELQRQEPLVAHDDGKEWVVEGNYNHDKAQEGMGSVRIVINKFDGQLIDSTLPYVMFSYKTRK